MPTKNTNLSIIKAIKRGNEKDFKELISDPQFNPQQYDSEGLTPLCHLIRLEAFELLELFLQSPNIDTNFQNPNNGWTALFYCIEIGINAPLYIKEIENYKKLNLDIQDKSGNTALHYAAETNFVNIVEYLINLHASIDLSNNNKETPLHKAILSNSYEVVVFLLNIGADCFIKQKDGYSALFLSILENNDNTTYSILVKLSENLFNLKKLTDNKGNTPLHIAIESGSSKNIINQLGELGFSFDELNNSGLSPKDLQNQQEDIYEMQLAAQKEEQELKRKHKQELFKTKKQETEVYKFCKENNISDELSDKLFKMNIKFLDDSFFSIETSTLEKWKISNQDISAFFKSQESLIAKQTAEALSIRQKHKEDQKLKEKKRNLSAIFVIIIFFASIYLLISFMIQFAPN